MVPTKCEFNTPLGRLPRTDPLTALYGHLRLRPSTSDRSSAILPDRSSPILSLYTLGRAGRTTRWAWRATLRANIEAAQLSACSVVGLSPGGGRAPRFARDIWGCRWKFVSHLAESGEYAKGRLRTEREGQGAKPATRCYPRTMLIHALGRAFCDGHGLAEELAYALAERFAVRSFGRGEHVMRAGSRDTSLYYIHEGVWRVYYSSSNGRQHNKAFLHEGMFFVAFSAYLEQVPLRFDVEALEDTEALSMPYVEFEHWMERDPRIAGSWRRYMQAHFVRHEAREAVLQLEDAAGRYLWFLQRHPGLVDRVPLYHVASYLGLTNVTLSRVRRRLADRF